MARACGLCSVSACGLLQHLKKAGRFTRDQTQFFVAEVVAPCVATPLCGCMHRRLPPTAVILWVILWVSLGHRVQVALALEYLHKKSIAYRDIKPENMVIHKDGHVMLTGALPRPHTQSRTPCHN